jgi:spore coat protein U-like protein
LWPVFSAARREFDKVKSNIKQRVLKILALSAVLIGHAGLSLPVYPASSTSDINISANINGSCTMSNTDLNFGAYDAIVANATQDLTAFATISTACTSGATAKVTMGNGLHSTTEWRYRGRMAFFTHYRHMSNAGSDIKLQYELYTNENHTTVWNQSNFRDIVGSGASEDLTVYGKVFKNQQDAVAGSYTDTINIEVIY